MAVSKLKTFQSLGVADILCSCLQHKRLTTPTNIQRLAIPSLLTSREHHLLAAQTGTGKTLSYLLPVLQVLKAAETKAGTRLTRPNAPRGIVIVPTRELSEQLDLLMRDFKHNIRLKNFSVHSGVKRHVVSRELGEGQDLLVGTLEQLARCRRESILSLSHVEEMVFDECDTLVDAGFGNSILEYIDKLSSRVRFTFVGATRPKQVDQLLLQRFSFSHTPRLPYIKRVVDSSTHLNLDNIHHELVSLSSFDKNPQLLKALKDNIDIIKRRGACIVFCNSVKCANATAYTLKESGYSTAVLHGDVPSERRQQNVSDFRDKKVEVLVCTDLGSRGLDFPDAKLVIQYDFPETTSDYLHRVGRTGRGGSVGTAISFFRKKDQEIVQQLEQSFSKNTPLQIAGSAYSFKNKEEMRKK